MNRIAFKCLAASAILSLVGAQGAQAAGVFTLKSSAFSDNGKLAKKSAGADKSNPNCIGQNVSPPFAWSNAPAGTKSFAFLMYDPEGRAGLGVSHQVAYGIPAATTGFKQGELEGDKGFVGGKSTPGKTAYYGPCPPPGSGLHHYIFTIVATDLEPDALEPGLTREQLFEKLSGHSKGVAGTIARFGM